MKVYFIGAGPGASDLITIRGADILARVPVVLYAGSLVPPAILTHCRLDAEIINSAELTLDQQIEHYQKARSIGYDVARVHSGDPSIYGATAEQMRGLKQLGIDYEVVPGVSSFTAAAACIRTELTKPEVSQTIILTRTEGRASAVPIEESIGELASHGATMSIFLSGQYLKETVAELLEYYPEDTPAALVYRATWPDERTHVSTLGGLLQEINPADWKLTTVLLVGQALSNDTGSDSRLYAADYSHKFRNIHTSGET
jgi:precorrin-4/cobalt-precorrin-4 C11-methyltransferase